MLVLRINLVVMAPLTWIRVQEGIPDQALLQYYLDRAHGGLIITQGVLISEEAGGSHGIPGLYTPAQLEGWQRVLNHLDSIVFCQLWAMGSLNNGLTGIPIVGPSQTSFLRKGSGPNPRPLLDNDIERYTQSYAQAAQNALAVGFQGCEVHAAHGYLLEQFLFCSDRTDEYGGSLENRCRFLLQVLDKVIQVCGQDRVGVRLSPYSEYSPLSVEETRELYGYLCQTIASQYPRLSYVSMSHSKSSQTDNSKEADFKGHGDSKRSTKTDLDEYRRYFKAPTQFIRIGGYTAQEALNQEDLVGFGRLFVSNPDLVDCIRRGIPLKPFMSQ